MKTYRVSEVFYSPQGEGVRAGTMNIFVRFSGCNLQCDIAPGPLSPGGFMCDTEFMSNREMNGKEILAYAEKIGNGCKAVIFTGGEPTLQLDDNLLAEFKAAGYYTAIETNGTRRVSPLVNWICISPKVAEHAIKQLSANEIKYVRAYGQGIPKPAVKADNYLISPALEAGKLPEENLKWAIKLVRENPTWRLSVQQHQLWKVR